MAKPEKAAKDQPTKIPPQHQPTQPGVESQMRPLPEFIRPNYRGSEKLKGKVALITGGDSGIGRAIAVHYAREGADVSIVYLNEHQDAEETKKLVEKENRECFLFAGDVSNERFCELAVERTVKKFGKLDILVNNAAEQHVEEDVLRISSHQLERTFRVNIFAYFYMIQAALKQMRKNGVIINTTSVTAYKGSSHLIDYSATKGAIVSLTRSLSQALIKKEIRVNAVAPGPIWTPLIPATFDSEQVSEFGTQYPMGRPGQPSEVAPSYVFLASDDSSYMSGQVLHPNGGELVGG